LSIHSSLLLGQVQGSLKNDPKSWHHLSVLLQRNQSEGRVDWKPVKI
jgi:hypothetical protein